MKTLDIYAAKKADLCEILDRLVDDLNCLRECQLNDEPIALALAKDAENGMLKALDVLSPAIRLTIAREQQQKGGR